MFEKTKSFATGATKVVVKAAIPGMAGAFAGKEKYDECKANGDGAIKTTLKTTSTAIYEQTKYSVGGALLLSDF